MNQFRDELLEYVLIHSGEIVDIKFLTDKYCGESNVFDYGDESISRCRLSINRVLAELMDMGWVNVLPTHGMSTIHSLNHQLNKRQYTMDYPLKVRMTTKGELEYKKSKNEDVNQNNSINIGGDFIGNANTGISNTQSSRVANLATPIPDKKHKTIMNILSIVSKWIFDNFIKIIVGVMSAYIIYRMGFKK